MTIRYRQTCDRDLALSIYAKYLRSGAAYEIDIAPQVRRNILNNIERNNFTPTMFTQVQTQAFNALAADSYVRFCSVKSREYVVHEPKSISV